MNDVPLWVTLLIGLFGGGAIVSLASNITTQIIASRAAVQQKQNENFLQTTKQHIDSLYIPINRSLSKLSDSYELYKKRKATLKALKSEKVAISPDIPTQREIIVSAPHREYLRQITIQSFKEFIAMYRDFLKLINEITEQGTDVYLSTEFEDRLRSLTLFLKTVANEEWMVSERVSENIEVDMTIDSAEFHERFLRDYQYLKSYIKSISFGPAEIKNLPKKLLKAP